MSPLITTTTISLIAVIISALALIVTTGISVYTSRSNSRRATAQMLFSTRIDVYRRYLKALDQMESYVDQAVFDAAIDQLNDEAAGDAIFNEFKEAQDAAREIRMIDGELGRDAEQLAINLNKVALFLNRDNYDKPKDFRLARQRIAQMLYPKFTKALMGETQPYHDQGRPEPE